MNICTVFVIFRVFFSLTHISSKSCSSAAKAHVEYCVWFQAPQHKTDTDILEWVLQGTTKVPGVGAPVVFWRCAEAPFHLNYFIILSFSPFFSFSVATTYHPGKPTDFIPLWQIRAQAVIWLHQVSRCGLRHCFCTLKTEIWPLCWQRGPGKGPIEVCKGQWGLLAGIANSEPPSPLPIAEIQPAPLPSRARQIGFPNPSKVPLVLSVQYILKIFYIKIGQSSFLEHKNSLPWRCSPFLIYSPLLMNSSFCNFLFHSPIFLFNTLLNLLTVWSPRTFL